MARPTKFTPERAQAICDNLKAGCTRKAAAGAAGVSFDTFLRWAARYASFATAVSRAEDEAEAKFTKVIEKAADDGDWRAAESWLKRRRRPDWGDNVALDVDREIAELMARLASGAQEETS